MAFGRLSIAAVALLGLVNSEPIVETSANITARNSDVYMLEIYPAGDSNCNEASANFVDNNENLSNDAPNQIRCTPVPTKGVGSGKFLQNPDGIGAMFYGVDVCLKQNSI